MSPSPSSSWKAVVVALCTAGGAAFVLSSSSSEPLSTPRSAAVARAEDDTRAALDERMALHLLRLR